MKSLLPTAAAGLLLLAAQPAMAGLNDIFEAQKIEWHEGQGGQGVDMSVLVYSFASFVLGWCLRSGITYFTRLMETSS
nr:p9 [synthetic construct]